MSTQMFFFPLYEDLGRENQIDFASYKSDHLGEAQSLPEKVKKLHFQSTNLNLSRLNFNLFLLIQHY